MIFCFSAVRVQEKSLFICNGTGINSNYLCLDSKGSVGVRDQIGHDVVRRASAGLWRGRHAQPLCLLLRGHQNGVRGQIFCL